MIIQMLSSHQDRKGSWSYIGLTRRMEKVGITNYKKEGIFCYFEVVDYKQLQKFKERFKIYSGQSTCMIETIQNIQF